MAPVQQIQQLNTTIRTSDTDCAHGNVSVWCTVHFPRACTPTVGLDLISYPLENEQAAKLIEEEEANRDSGNSHQPAGGLRRWEHSQNCEQDKPDFTLPCPLPPLPLPVVPCCNAGQSRHPHGIER
jgi:hypothetical protein